MVYFYPDFLCQRPACLLDEEKLAGGGGRTPLLVAATQGHTDPVELLLVLEDGNTLFKRHKLAEAGQCHG